MKSDAETLNELIQVTINHNEQVEHARYDLEVASLNFSNAFRARQEVSEALETFKQSHNIK